ncbi:MAG TPA: hypothetical protein VEC60_10055 [Reyranella sp.]|nr:hypothetical protein [Reyranella sp.]
MRLAIACIGFVLTATPAVAQEIDTTGKGAVLCAWQIFQTVRNVIDACAPGEFQALRSDMSWAIDATNDFIAANSPQPVTKAELEAVVARDAERDRARFTSASCPTLREQWIESWSSVTMGEPFRRGVADMLSVPRKPVMNPCV